MGIRARVENAFLEGAFRVSPALRNLRESFQSSSYSLQESLVGLQQLVEDQQDWIKLTGDTQQEFSGHVRRELIQRARALYLKNPLFRRATKLNSFYTFGKGIKIGVQDSEGSSTHAIVDDFAKRNRNQLSESALMEKNNTLIHDGNLFWCLFTDQANGQVTLRTIDTLQITDIYCNPEDAEDPWYYKREWSESMLTEFGTRQTKQRVLWYPALGYQPATGERMDFIGGAEVRWDSPILHRKIGSLEKWRYGIPEYFSGADWMQEWSRNLEDYITRNRNLARVGLKVQGPGGRRQREANAASYNSSLNTGQGYENNPDKLAGAAAFFGKETSMEALKLAGATIHPDEGRQVKLQIMAATGFPEHFFGDPSTSNLATSKTLDRPTELMIEAQQEMWREDLERILAYVLEQSSRPAGARAFKQEGEQEAMPLVEFPNLLDHELEPRIAALVSLCNLYKLDPRAALSIALPEFGLDSDRISGILDALYPEPYDPSEWAQDPNAEVEAQAAALATRQAQANEALGNLGKYFSG